MGTLTIDNDLRTVSVPSDVFLGVESDDGVNRVHFEMPRNYGEFDLSDFDIRINYKNGGKGDAYLVDDKSIGEDAITFSWLAGRGATTKRGHTYFSVCLRKTDSEGNVTQEFNTAVAALKVLPGLETTEQIINKNTDLIAQILTKVSESSIGQVVGTYLEKNPPAVTEADPTVPAWAKAETKPDYYYSEILEAPQEMTNTEIEALISSIGGL